MKKGRKIAKTAGPERSKTEPTGRRTAKVLPKWGDSDGSTSVQKGDAERGTVVTPEDSGPQSAVDQNIIINRQAAKYAIALLSSASKAGNDLALQALYEVATVATEQLNDQSLERRKSIAGSHLEWPLILTHSKTWNKDLMAKELHYLGLGKKQAISVNLDYVLTKPSDLKETMARLMALIIGWQEEPTEMAAARRAAQTLVTQGYGEEGCQYALDLGRKKLAEAKELTSERIEGLKRFLEVSNETNFTLLYQCKKRAIALVPISVNEKTRDQWFDVAIEALNVLTGGAYHLSQSKLRYWGGIPFVSEKEDLTQDRALKTNILRQLRLSFERMLTDVP